MSTANKLDWLGAELRRAVSQGSFEGGKQLLGEYAAELERQLHSGHAGPSEVQTALALFEWARRNTLSARAHGARRLSGTLAAARYFRQPREILSTLDLQG